jgi:hypothetical protein
VRRRPARTPIAEALVGRPDALDHAVAFGDDYELLFSTDALPERVTALAAEHGTSVARIGTISSGNAVVLTGRAWPAARFAHFGFGRMIRSIVLLATVGVTVGVGAVTDPMKALPVALVLVFLAGLFSGSETALFSLQQGDRAELRDRRHRLGKRSTVDGLLSDPRSTLASILIGNESVNVLLSTITAGVLFHLAPDKKWLNVVLLPALPRAVR